MLCSFAYAKGACRIDKIPRNGWIESAAPPFERFSPGEYVNPFSVVNFKCLERHIIEGPTASFCTQSKWTNEVPNCEPRCSTKDITGISIIPSSCFLNDKEVRCSEPAKPGTIARINCRERYERGSNARQQIITCDDNGVWSPLPEVCTPICGEEAPSGTPYVIGGFKTEIGNVPWHAGIYRDNGGGRFDLQCGATILNARVVISAMHCFWDRSEGKPLDVSSFRIAVGKEKLDYDAIENQRDQKFEIERIFHDPGYSDSTSNYVADIVLIILKTPIQFESYITPVCIPYGLQFDERIVPAGWLGRVAGWGLTSSGGKPSPVLKIVDLPSVDRATCVAESDIGFRPQITPDKFCAGLLNSNVSVCQGKYPLLISFQAFYSSRKNI